MGEVTIDRAMEIALELHRAGRCDEARAIYQRVLQAEPSHADALHLLGVVEYQQNHPAAAEEFIRRAIAIAPLRAGYHSNLGNALQAQGKVGDAIACFRRATEIEPRHHEAWNNLGSALQSAGEIAAAVECHQRAITLQPTHASAHNNLGNALRLLGRFESAETSYRRAIELRADYADAHHNLAVTLLSLGRVNDAEISCREAMRLRSEFAEAHHTLALALEKLGRGEEAIAQFERTVQLRPESQAWQFDLAAARSALPAWSLQRPCPAPNKAPAEFVAKLFDDYAEWFDSHLTHVLDYHVCEGLLELVRKFESRTDLAILDLGCGTGLGAKHFKPIATRIVGVDLSPRMLDQARARNLYDQLIQADLTAALGELRGRGERFDLILAADVLLYSGDLHEIFAAVAGALRRQIIFAFSVEALDVGDEWALQPTRRYAHSLAYLQSAAAACELEEIATQRHVLRKQSDRPVEGWLALFRKRK